MISQYFFPDIFPKLNGCASVSTQPLCWWATDCSLDDADELEHQETGSIGQLMTRSSAILVW